MILVGAEKKKGRVLTSLRCYLLRYLYQNSVYKVGTVYPSSSPSFIWIITSHNGCNYQSSPILPPHTLHASYPILSSSFGGTLNNSESSTYFPF
ncbi:hypothetical protein CEXT_180231 [Caerostris extrusa]|uniref:Uncharacterized protein n=1 Tax=Caerostris extrusa TaxID=172846 RepID=A0AAV4Q7K9_CAEEX|nr:hypothetical protein CEXT_180231 [Caerostris extrusa]